MQIIPTAPQFHSEMFYPCDYARLSEDIMFLLQVGWKPWTHQCKVVPYGRWWKNRSLVVKDERQITMDSGGPSAKIPSDQDCYTRQARSCSVGDPIQGVLQHRWKSICIPEQGEQMQEEIRFQNYHFIFRLLNYNLIFPFINTN